MAIDGYTLCPGGTGKRIKFCCKDFLPELQQIDRMLDGQQNQACLDFIARLEEKKPERACLLAIQADLLRAVQRPEELQATVGRFLEQYPGNPVALAQSAMLVVETEGGPAALAVLQQALEAAGQQMLPALYQAMGHVAVTLLEEGQILAARMLFLAQLALEPDDPHPMKALTTLNVSPRVPLLLKEGLDLTPCPDDFPRKTEFDRALEPTQFFQWRESEKRLAALAETAPDSPAVWHDLAALRSWLADAPGAAEALRRFAALDVPWEDAVEAEARAMLMSDDPLGDQVELLSLTYPVADVEAVQEALTASPQAVALAVDPAQMPEGSPPPKTAFLLLDRAAINRTAEETEIPLSQIPRAVAQVLLFGRETDRDARLELPMISSRARETIRPLLEGVLGPIDETAVSRRDIGRLSVTRELLRPDWQLPRTLGPKEALSLADRLRNEALLQQWVQLPLGVLGGKSPQAAAGDPSQRRRLAAVVMVVEEWAEQSAAHLDGNQLRAALGLPALGPIDPQQTPPESVPLVRLARIAAEKLADEALVQLYRRALGFRVAAALENLARLLLACAPKGYEDEVITACRLLAERETDTDRALECVAQGRKLTTPKKVSCVPWDFMELSLRMERGQGQEVVRLIEHIQTAHLREPGVASSLVQFLVQMGLVRPDGTLVAPAEEEESPIAAPAGKLWTPDGNEAGAQGKKLWTPG